MAAAADAARYAAPWPPPPPRSPVVVDIGTVIERERGGGGLSWLACFGRWVFVGRFVRFVGTWVALVGVLLPILNFVSVGWASTFLIAATAYHEYHHPVLTAKSV